MWICLEVANVKFEAPCYGGVGLDQPQLLVLLLPAPLHETSFISGSPVLGCPGMKQWWNDMLNLLEHQAQSGRPIV